MPSIFNHSAWISVLARTYNFQFEKFVQDGNEYYFYVKKNSKGIKYSYLPFTDEIDIINKDSFNIILEKLVDNNKSVFIEVRNSIDHKDFKKEQVGYKHTLNLLKATEEIFAAFKKTQVQQPIIKSIKDGLIATISKELKEVYTFYDLHLRTRKKLGVPVQPKKFFNFFFEEIIAKDLGFLVMVYLENQVISSGVFTGYGNSLIYKFSASDQRYLNYRPNNLMLWTAIQEAKKRGFEIFDFGRTDLDTEGLRKFKLGWGTEEEPLYYSYYPKAPEITKFRFIKNNIVSPIIRNSPKFVCRLTGELFYKYFG